MSATPSVEDLIVLGKITSVHGVRGEVKIYSFTDPIDNLLGYPAWTLKRDGEVKQVELVSGRLQGKILVAIKNKPLETALLFIISINALSEVSSVFLKSKVVSFSFKVFETDNMIFSFARVSLNLAGFIVI